MTTPNRRDVFVPSLSEFYVLDYDRTLGDVGKHYQVLVDVLESEGVVSSQRMQALRAEVEARGGSFDPLSYLFSQSMLNEDLFSRVTERYLSQPNLEQFLMPGARLLLDYFNSAQLSYGIVTYGDPRWQLLKLQASGLNGIPYVITNVKHKGELLTSWRLNSGEFKLPGEFGDAAFDSLVLIDDKAASFIGLPALPTHGYHIYDSRVAVPSQAGDLPPNVHRVTSLDELTDLLKSNRQSAE